MLISGSVQVYILNKEKCQVYVLLFHGPKWLSFDV